MKTYGSIDLGTENLGVWVGQASVGPQESVTSHPVRLEDGAWAVDAGGKTYKAKTLWWNRVGLLDDMPIVVRTVKKKTGAIERKKVKPPMQEQIEYAIKPQRIPAVVETFKRLGVEEIFIETQLANLQSMTKGNTAGNLLMKVLSHAIQILMRLSIPDVGITFVSGSGTIPLCEDISWEKGSTWERVVGKERRQRGTPLTKPQKKRLAIDTMSYILQVVDSDGKCPHHVTYKDQKKRDDMADAMLQVWGYMRHQDKRPKNAKKRKEPEVENEKEKNERGILKVLKRKHVSKSMAAMKAELKEWKCVGYSSLKRAELEDFYLKARDHVMRGSTNQRSKKELSKPIKKTPQTKMNPK